VFDNNLANKRDFFQYETEIFVESIKAVVGHFFNFFDVIKL